MTGSREVVEVTVTAMTHRGAVREGNEDAFVVGALTSAGVDTVDPVVVRLLVEEATVVAVADGLGGHSAGEIASALAVRRLAERAPRSAGAGDLLPSPVSRLVPDQSQLLALSAVTASAVYGHWNPIQRSCSHS